MKRVIAILFVLFAFTSCGVVKQIKQVTNMASCDFKLINVEDVRVAGISLENKKSIGDLSLTDATRLAQAAVANSFPLTFMLNVEAHNPNDQIAGLNTLEWTLYIDDIEMVSGVNAVPISIPAKGTTVIPLAIDVELQKVLTGRSGQAIMNFGFNLAGENGVPTRIKLKAKPTILVGNFPISYPGYITVTNVVK